MYILYVTKIYLLTLLKISYEIGIGLLVLLATMALITYLKGDKAIFTKQYKKVRSELFELKSITK